MLRDIRHRLGWTQDNMAKYLGVSRRSIIRWENKQVEPSSMASALINNLKEKLVSEGMYKKSIWQKIKSLAGVK